MPRRLWCGRSGVRRWRPGWGWGVGAAHSGGDGTRSHGQRHSPEPVGGQLAARQAQVPKRAGAAEEELQRCGRSPGLPGAGEREKWASGRREAAPGSLSRAVRPNAARPGPPSYVREKTFLEASRWVRLAQQPRDSAAKSCRRRVWAAPAGGLSPPRQPCHPVYPRAAGRVTSPTDHPPPPLTTPSQCPGRCLCLRDSGTSERWGGSGNYRVPGGRIGWERGKKSGVASPRTLRSH